MDIEVVHKVVGKLIDEVRKQYGALIAQGYPAEEAMTIMKESLAGVMSLLNAGVSISV
jgi:hypothetical protein